MDKIYEELYDEDLVQLGRDGDPMAFEQLFSRYKTMVNSKARAYFWRERIKTTFCRKV